MINALNPGRNPDISLVFPDVNLQRIAAHCFNAVNPLNLNCRR